MGPGPLMSALSGVVSSCSFNLAQGAGRSCFGSMPASSSLDKWLVARSHQCGHWSSAKSWINSDAEHVELG